MRNALWDCISPYYVIGIQTRPITSTGNLPGLVISYDTWIPHILLHDHDNNAIKFLF